MSDFVTVVANYAVEVATKDGPVALHKKGDAPFMISTADFADLGPDGLGAVRRPKPAERNPLDHDGNGKDGGAVVLTPHHKGGGKWDVVDATNVAVSDRLFDTKEEAQAAIDNGTAG